MDGVFLYHDLKGRTPQQDNKQIEDDIVSWADRYDTAV